MVVDIVATHHFDSNRNEDVNKNENQVVDFNIHFLMRYLSSPLVSMLFHPECSFFYFVAISLTVDVLPLSKIEMALKWKKRRRRKIGKKSWSVSGKITFVFVRSGFSRIKITEMPNDLTVPLCCCFVCLSNFRRTVPSAFKTNVIRNWILS